MQPAGWDVPVPSSDEDRTSRGVPANSAAVSTNRVTAILQRGEDAGILKSADRSAASTPLANGAGLPQGSEANTGYSLQQLKELLSPSGEATDCLLGPRQQHRALTDKEGADKQVRIAAKYWGAKWEEYMEEHPDVLELERPQMKVAFDAWIASAMREDYTGRVPKVHFSAVMFWLKQSSHFFKKGKIGKQFSPEHVRYWCELWEEYTEEHQEVIGTARATMKDAFLRMQSQDRASIPRVHFCFVMNCLRIAGKHDIGTWKEYKGNVIENVDVTWNPAWSATAPEDGDENTEAGAGECVLPTYYLHQAGDVDDQIVLEPGSFDSMRARSDQAPAAFDQDVQYLWASSRLSLIEVQWEEDRIYLSGQKPIVAEVKKELTKILNFYFPEGIPVVAKCVGSADDEENEQAHWTQRLESTLTSKKREKTLALKQSNHEKQREGTAHWADRWDAYAKLHPEVIGKDRDTMKAAFDTMQEEAAGDAPKAHFSLVMNFLRQSGRRTVGTWQDYEPTKWIS